MKIFNLLSWIGFGAAVVFMICGLIDFMNGGGVFGLKHSSTFFTVANTALLEAVFFKLLDFGAKKTAG